MTDMELTTAPRDEFVVRELSRLGRHSAGPAFSRHVMARVRRPQPSAVVLLRRARAWMLEPRRALVLAGGYAASAVLALWLVLPWLAARSAAIGFGAQWLSERALGAVRDAALALAGWAVASGLAEFIQSLSLSGERMWLALVTLSIGYAGCGAGLHYLLRTPRGKDVRVVPPV